MDTQYSHGGSALHLQVDDTGCGIAAADAELIFQPFVQVDGTMTRRHGGTGISLALAQRMVERMGGAITFSSRIGQGSTFRIVIPFTAPTVGATDLPPSATRRWQNHRGSDTKQ